MNYLAHFHLAEQLAGHTACDPRDLLVGALLGDYVKGPLRGDYPAGWETGIWLHRRIDALTDRHPLVQQCLVTLPAHYRRFGGIMLDVCFDHCLSTGWSEHDHRALDSFTRHCYATILEQQTHFPSPAQRQITYLARYDVLGLLDDWNHVTGMLARIGQRLRVRNPLDSCGDALHAQLPAIRKAFSALYPALLTQLTADLQQHLGPS